MRWSSLKAGDVVVNDRCIDIVLSIGRADMPRPEWCFTYHALRSWIDGGHTYFHGCFSDRVVEGTVLRMDRP